MKLELAHDFIAKKIYDNVSIEDKTRAKATKFLHDRYQYYLASEDLLLTEQDMIYIARFIDVMDLSEGELVYIKKSKSAIKRRKIKARLKDAVLVALVCTIFFGSLGYWEHSRFQTATKELENAKDTINDLRNLGLYANAQEKEALVDKSSEGASLGDINAGASGIQTNFFSTIKLSGTVKNEQSEALAQATVSVLGAEVFTKEDGSFEVHLVLPATKLAEDVYLRISKPNYLSQSKLINVDKANLNFDMVLVRN